MCLFVCCALCVAQMFGRSFRAGLQAAAGLWRRPLSSVLPFRLPVWRSVTGVVTGAAGRIGAVPFTARSAGPRLSAWALLVGTGSSVAAIGAALSAAPAKPPADSKAVNDNSASAAAAATAAAAAEPVAAAAPPLVPLGPYDIVPNGQLYCWGSNTFGQCGNGSEGLSQPVPYRIELDGPVTSIAAGLHSTFAVTGT
jgi:hypothetical protein